MVRAAVRGCQEINPIGDGERWENRHFVRLPPSIALDDLRLDGKLKQC
jgi:hypothetical protein